VNEMTEVRYDVVVVGGGSGSIVRVVRTFVMGASSHQELPRQEPSPSRSGEADTPKDGRGSTRRALPHVCLAPGDNLHLPCRTTRFAARHSSGVKRLDEGDRDKRQADIPHLLQEALQGRLIDDRAAEHG
jgi:hypothetical protein